MAEEGQRPEATRLADLVHRVVADGADTAEEIHRAIADLPLEILERLDVFKETAEDVQRIQDTSIGAIYDVIRRVNEEVTRMAHDLGKTASQRRRPAAGKTGEEETP